MLTLGIDPGERNVGWFVIVSYKPLAGGTLQLNSRRHGSVFRSVLTFFEQETRVAVPDLIAVENGNSSNHTKVVVRAAKDFANRHGILFCETSPRTGVVLPNWAWRSSHEKDACRAALDGLQQLTIQRMAEIQRG